MKEKEKKKSRKGWIIALCVVLVVILLAAGGAWVYFMELRADLTDEKPVEIPKVTVTEPEKKQLVKDYETLRKNVKQGKASEINLPSDKIDKMISMVDELSPLRGKVSIALQDDIIKAKVSMPLKKIPMFEGRYLNGEFKVKASIVDGKPVVKILEGKTEHGLPYPKWMLNQINEFAASPKVMEHPKAKWLKKVELFEVNDSKVTLKTK